MATMIETPEQRAARLRSEPPTDKQLDALRKLRINAPCTSRWDATLLIDDAIKRLSAQSVIESRRFR